MVTCQSANQLKTPAKVSWVFKMVSVWFTRRHNHGEDCWSDSCPEDNHWHPSQGGKTQTFITKEAVHRVLYPSMLTESRVEGKRCTTNRENRSLMRIVKQNRFKNLGELHKEWTEAGVKASRAPHTDVSRNLATVVVRGVFTWAKRRRTGLLPSGPKSSSDESKFCISFVNQGPRVWRKGGEAHSTSCLKSSVKFPQSVMIWVKCHLLVLVHCVFWKPTSLHPFTKKFWSTSCFLLLSSFLKMLISFSSRIWHLPTLPKAPKVG